MGVQDSGVAEKVRVKKPRMFNVILLNDNFTSMDFVVSVLVTVFQKSRAEAQNIMMTVHTKGKGQCGVYPLQIAEAKVEKVHQMARAEGFPLRCQIEPN